MESAINKIKQPAPSVGVSESKTVDGKKCKIIPAAHTGVVSAPKISKTPLTDMIELKKEERPYTVYKIKNKKYRIKGFQTTASLGVVTCAIISLVKLFGKKMG